MIPKFVVALIGGMASGEVCVLRSHGGRVRALHQSELKVDIAIIAAPTADELGNCNGLQYAPC